MKRIKHKWDRLCLSGFPKIINAKKGHILQVKCKVSSLDLKKNQLYEECVFEIQGKTDPIKRTVTVGLPGLFDQIRLKYYKRLKERYKKRKQGEKLRLVFTDDPKQAARDLPIQPRGEKAGWEPTGVQEKIAYAPEAPRVHYEPISLLLYNIQLGKQEKQVVEFLAQGYSKTHTANELRVSKPYISKLLKKLRENERFRSLLQ